MIGLISHADMLYISFTSYNVYGPGHSSVFRYFTTFKCVYMFHKNLEQTTELLTYQIYMCRTKIFSASTCKQVTDIHTTIIPGRMQLKCNIMLVKMNINAS